MVVGGVVERGVMKECSEAAKVREKTEAASWAGCLIEVFAVLTVCSTVQTQRLVLPDLSEIMGGFVYAEMKLQASVIVGEPGQEHSVYSSQLASER